MDRLKAIGLNLYERKLYVALIARGTATAGELSEMAGVPRSRAYDVLATLANKGFVVVQHTKPLRYVSIPPIEALDKTKEVLKQTLKGRMHSKGISLVEPAELSGAMKGKYAMYQQLGMMLKSAQTNIDIITTENELNELWSNHSGVLQNAKDGGVTIRVIAPITQNNKDAAEALSNIVELKALESEGVLPYGRMFIVDGREVILGLTDDTTTHATQDISFWTSSDHFAKNFATTTFNMVWSQLE